MTMKFDKDRWKEQPKAFTVLAKDADIKEAIKDVWQETTGADIERLSEEDMIHIATIWHCLNMLRRHGVSHGELGEILYTYFGADRLVPWKSSPPRSS
jgi:hypothetical protein